MTPFGAKVRALRADRNITLKQMAADLELSEAYLSTLEHGRGAARPKRSRSQICEYFNLIWDDYEEMHRLAALSHPKVTVDTSGLTPAHTELANTLAEKVQDISEQDAIALLARLRGDLY